MARHTVRGFQHRLDTAGLHCIEVEACWVTLGELRTTESLFRDEHRAKPLSRELHRKLTAHASKRLGYAHCNWKQILADENKWRSGNVAIPALILRRDFLIRKLTSFCVLLTARVRQSSHNPYCVNGPDSSPELLASSFRALND